MSESARESELSTQSLKYLGGDLGQGIAEEKKGGAEGLRAGVKEGGGGVS